MIKRTRSYRTQRIVKEMGRFKLASTVDDKPIWDLLKEYINDLPKNCIFTRKQMLNKIYNVNMQNHENAADKYRCSLTHINVLERIGNGKYKKLRGIPITLTTSQLKKILNKNSWESWFMSIDYV